MSDAKIIDLQTRLTYQEQAIKELSDVIHRQQKQIDDLIGGFKLLTNRTRELLSQTAEDGGQVQRPPHY